MGEPAPSGTVVVLRDAPELELLLLQRLPRAGRPVPWVFPGGKVEAADRRPLAAAADDARRAAVREAWEEAALRLAPEALRPISRWITPPVLPRRFDTWFFAASAPPDTQVRVDGAEIGHHRWLRPEAALRAHRAGDLPLAPPTFVTAAWLTEFASSAEALRVLPERAPATFRPRLHRVEGGTCMLYPGDAGYEIDRLDVEGARHRLWALSDGWRYERRDVRSP